MEDIKIRRMINIAFATVGVSLLIYFIIMCVCFCYGEYIGGGIIMGMFIVLYFLLRHPLREILKSSSFKEIYKK